MDGADRPATGREEGAVSDTNPEYEFHVEQVRQRDTRMRERRMNELGAEGWTLTSTSSGGFGYTNFHFQRAKRPGQAPTPPQQQTPDQRDTNIVAGCLFTIVGLIALLLIIGLLARGGR
jgi:hypothetical protein